MSSLSSSFPDEEKEQQLLKAQLRHERNLHLQLHDRFSLPFYIRIPFATSLSFLIGLSLGISHGSAVSGLRFRAENAHRLPTTPTGWYLYHKSKNYHRAFGGVKEGFKMGGKVAFWTAGFFAVEEMMDQYRGRKDFFNTVVASCTVAGGFSAWNRFPLVTAAKTAKTGLAIGLAYGLAQDAVGAARGRKPGYVEFIQRTTRRKAEVGGDQQMV